MNEPIERPRSRWWRWFALIALTLTLLSFADRNGWLLVPVLDDMAAYDGVTVRVVRVFDGDTIEVDRPDALRDRPVTRVRLWGIDCPEAAWRDRAAEPLAAEATEMTRRLVEGTSVLLRLESARRRGTFGRVLAHAELPDGSTLNEVLLEAGLAVADERWPHSRLVRYEQAESSARRKRVGIWLPSRADAGKARPKSRPPPNGGVDPLAAGVGGK